MPQGALLFQPTDYPHQLWTDHLRRFMPELDIRTSDDEARRSDIAYCVAWKPKPGSLRSLANVKVIFSMVVPETSAISTG